MKFDRTPKFDREYSKLTPEEKTRFKAVLAVFIAACKHFEQHPTAFIWPASLRFEKLVGSDNVYAITWSFSRPDGRATFEIQTIDDEIWIYWRRLGRHDIYNEP